MFSTKSLATASALLSLIASSTATYDAASPANLAVYWVSMPCEYRLLGTDIIYRDKAQTSNPSLISVLKVLSISFQ